MRTLRKPGHWKKDCPMRAISKNKRFSCSFENGTIKFKYNYVTVENFKPFNLLNLSGNTPQIYECCQPVCEKKLENLLYSENVVTEQSSSKRSGLSICTVWSFQQSLELRLERSY